METRITKMEPKTFILRAWLLLVALLGIAACDAASVNDELAASVQAVTADECTHANRASYSIGGELRCGACSLGFVENAERVCVARQTCAQLACGEGQVCEEIPNAVCL